MYFIECDSFGVDKTPDNCHLRPKNVVRKKNERK